MLLAREMKEYITIECKFCNNNILTYARLEGLKKYCNRWCYMQDKKRKLHYFNTDLILANFKKKVYKVNCHLCGKEEERNNRSRKVTCFDCKKKQRKIWRSDLTLKS